MSNRRVSSPSSPEQHDSFEEIPVRPHASHASQNLLSVTTDSDSDAVDLTAPSRSNSDTTLRNTKSPSKMSSTRPGNEDGIPAAKTGSLQEVQRSMSSDLDSGRSSGIYSRANDNSYARPGDARLPLHNLVDDGDNGPEGERRADSSLDDLDSLGLYCSPRGQGHDTPMELLSPRSTLSIASHSTDYGGAGTAMMSASMRPSTSTLLSHRIASDLRSAGASLPTSRGASPTPDQILGTGRRSGVGSTSADLRAFMVEKEVIESQLRKIQVENSSLHTENKLLKEKHNRAQARIQYLEAQVRASQKEADHLKYNFSDEMSSIKRQSRDKTDRDVQDLEEQVMTLTKDMETLRAENGTLEQQLELAQRSADIVRQSSDRSKIMESFKTEVITVREELGKVKQLMEQCERDRQEEGEKRREASVQVVKLTELKAMLQQQLENAGGGSVAEKQVSSLERRLKITEDRLHQERSDRAGKLSQVEEKLINENAKLQVSEKELKRKWNREVDKNRNLNDKFRDGRDENERMRIQISEKPLLMDTSSFRSKMANNVGTLGAKKHAEEMKQILQQMKEEEDMNPDQSNDMIWLLWHQREELSRQLKEWELGLGDLQIDHRNIADGLKATREEQSAFEEKLQRNKEELDDLTKEKIEMERTLREQVKTLVQEKHVAIAKAKDMEDISAAVNAENEALRDNLKMSVGLGTSRPGDATTREAQVVSLKSELQTLRGELQEASRGRQLAEGELPSLRRQLSAKTQALEEALAESQRLASSSSQDKQHSDWKAQKVDKLHAEIKGLQAEVRMWKDKCTSSNTERAQLEEKLQTLGKKMAQASFTGTSASSDPTSESDKLALESELQEKDSQVFKLTVQYNETENELQRTKQVLLMQQHHNDELDQQLDQLQTQLRMRSRTMEKMYSTEGDYQVELQALRENLASVNKELMEKGTELKRRTVELGREKEMVQKFRKDLNQRDELLSQNIANALHSGKVESVLFSDTSAAVTTTKDTLTHAETRVRLLQYEKESIQHELERTNASVDAVVKENSDLVARIRELRQELVRERAQLCQVTSEKVDAEQKLHVCTEERDSAQKVKGSLEQDVVKYETHTQRVIDKLETEALKASSEFEQKYSSMSSDSKKLAIDLATARRLLEAREKEVDLLRDTIKRQKQELDSQNRTIAVLKEENLTTREDIDRMTSELALKMRETAANSENTQYLSSERSKLQLEKFQLEKVVGKEKSEVERRAMETAELAKKLEKTEDLLKQAQTELRIKETKLVAVETDLKHANRDVSSVDGDRLEMKENIQRVNAEIRSMLGVGPSPVRETTLNEEKTSRNYLREELSYAARQIELIKNEYEVMTTNLQSERRSAQAHKEKCQTEEDKVYHMEESIRSQKLELDTLKSHLVESKNTIDQYKKDKQTLYQDVQDLCHKLAEKDESVARLQEKLTNTMEHIHRDGAEEKALLTQEKHTLEDRLATAKEEVEQLKEKLRQKEIQVDNYFHTARELEAETRSKVELDSRLSISQSEVHELRLKLTTALADNSRLTDNNQQHQDTLEQTRSTTTSLKEQLRQQRDQYTTEIHELKHSITELTHRHEMEKNDLQDQYNKVQANLKAGEVSLSAISETRESLHASNQNLERTMDTLKSQLHEEITGRKLAEQRVESLKTQMDEARQNKVGCDERSAELQTQLAKVEAELSLEKEKYRRLKQDLSTTQTHSTSSAAHAQTLVYQLTELKAEATSLRSQLETSKQTYSGREKRYILDLKQQAEQFEKERSKLMLQAQQLSVDLEQAREQVALKNRDNLRLQEENLSVTERQRDANRSVKQTSDSLRAEVESREKLDHRAEVSRMLADLSRRMQGQLLQHRDSDNETRAKDVKKMEDYKRKIVTLESTLSQEQALHIVTKTQLQSLEEDNLRLRQQLQTLRRRNTHTGEHADRTKNRMEEINEIIARSQTRAQQLLASGAYSDDPLKTLNPSRDFLSTMPNLSLYSPTPTEGRSMASDDITTATMNGVHENIYRKN